MKHISLFYKNFRVFFCTISMGAIVLFSLQAMQKAKAQSSTDYQNSNLVTQADDMLILSTINSTQVTEKTTGNFFLTPEWENWWTAIEPDLRSHLLEASGVYHEPQSNEEFWRIVDIETLTIENSGTDLTPLARLQKLQHLIIYDENVKNVSALFDLYELRELEYCANTFTKRQLRRLKRHCPQCTFTEINGETLQTHVSNFARTGYVKFYNKTEGSGFIVCEITGDELFFTVASLIDKVETNDLVRFKIVGTKNELQAVDIQLIAE